MRDEPKKPFWHDIAKAGAEEADERVAQNVFSETIFCLADVLGRLALLRYGEHGQKELSELVGDVYPADVEPPPKDVTAFDLWSCAQLRKDFSDELRKIAEEFEKGWGGLKR